MWCRALPVLFGLLLLAGCKTTALGPEWDPLKDIKQSEVLAVGLSTQGGRTIGDTVYVRDMQKFLADKPEGSVKWTAFLKHEQVHSKRQYAKGVTAWLTQYGTSRGFMWFEEQLGFYEQIKWLTGHGVGVVVDSWAENMSKYRNLVGPMVSFEEAKDWINKVLNGWWTPPGE